VRKKKSEEMNGNIAPKDPPSIPPIISPEQQRWKQTFPVTISGIIAFLQFVITVVIIGCEVGSVLIDIVTATIYVGFWAGLFFIVAWISLASSCM
jgi:hypothetical protein